MLRGRAIGRVWATRKAPGLANHKLLLVARGETLVVALDTLDVDVGEKVLVSWGSGARIAVARGPGNRDLLADAAVVQRIDSEE